PSLRRPRYSPPRRWRSLKRRTMTDGQRCCTYAPAANPMRNERSVMALASSGVDAIADLVVAALGLLQPLNVHCAALVVVSDGAESVGELDEGAEIVGSSCGIICTARSSSGHGGS